MPAKFNPPDQLEELSWFLDEMNVNHQPPCDDKEIAELLTVAFLLKDTDCQVLPPQHLLDQTVDRALAGIYSGKSKKIKKWFFSGVLGTAASVILALGLNLLPSWQEQIPLIPQIASTAQQQDTSQSKPIIEPPSTVFQTTPYELPKPEVIVPATVKQSPTREKRDLPAPPLPLTEVAGPQNTLKKSLIIEEKAPRLLDQAKSAYTPLSLPNKTPDLIVTDKENAMLRQTYYKGTSQEITITQNLHPSLNHTIQSKSKTSLTTETVKDKSNLINRVKVILFGQEIIIEGRQSKEELEKIAESLTP